MFRGGRGAAVQPERIDKSNRMNWRNGKSICAEQHMSCIHSPQIAKCHPRSREKLETRKERERIACGGPKTSILIALKGCRVKRGMGRETHKIFLGFNVKCPPL
jgi:hypothetical protein